MTARYVPRADRYFILRAYGSGWDVYGWSRHLDAARSRATPVGWVVLARDKMTAGRILYYHIKNADFMDKHKGNGRTVWRGK